MKRQYLFTAFIIFFSFAFSHAQDIPDQASTESKKSRQIQTELKGSVLDFKKQTPLPYASIYLLHKTRGVISNENGYFSLDISGLANSDTVCFQYIGYKTQCIPLGQLDTSSIIYLEEEIYDLNEIFVFGDPPDPESIVKKVLKNKESNYKKLTSARQTFIRERDITDFDEFNLNYKKSTIPELDEKTLQLIQEKIPRHTTSYTDFLGNIYLTKNEEDSVKFKIEPLRTVALKEKDLEELQRFDTLFENLFTGTEEEEYWKVRTGIFGDKIDNADTNSESKKDTMPESSWRADNYSRQVKSELNYTLLDDKDQWEFLYETGKYKYTLFGGTNFNGEDVYIIDFEPKRSGLYIGRMYVSVNTFALIRADYEYAPDRIGMDFHLLGIGYTETGFSGSIYFEKSDSTYLLKYFSKKAGAVITINRNLEISKKKKRLLFDKVLMEFDVGIKFKVRTENTFECVVLDDRQISEDQFQEFKQPEFMHIIYVDQFDDDLWSGYSILEPTKQMKEYRKQDFDLSIPQGKD